MKKRLLLPLLAIWLVTGAGCAREVDLAKSLSVTEVFSGWYDFGVVDGQNKLVPSISFKLQNVGDAPVRRVQMLVSFWQEGADGENDSKEVTGVGAEDLAPGSSSAPILVRSGVGYTSEQARAEMFGNSQFKDFTVKLFAKRAGRIVPLGEHKVERRVIPQTAASTTP